jgi:hypothetical protein
MCLFFITLLLGPRAAILFWWLFAPGRWDSAFDTFVWPLLGVIFLPWTTIMFVAVAPFGTVAGYDWMWLAFGFVADLAMHAGGGYGNRRRVPGYSEGRYY